MLYLVLYPLAKYISFFNIFRYITFRAAYGAVTALILAFIAGPSIIRRLKRLKISETISDDLPRRHKSKEGTPTMGGLIILLTLVVPVLLWADLTNRFIQLILITTVWLGAMGLTDDLLKFKKGKGMGGRYKLLGQFALGLIVGLSLIHDPVKEGYATKTSLLFLKNYFLDFGWFYIPFLVLVIVGSSNAVNLADGLDGLAIGMVAIGFGAYAILAYVTGHAKISDYLNVLFLPGAGELSVFCLAAVGASLGFLWFNTNPAQIFMGDTGSLALGGAIGTAAVLIKHEMLLLIIGGVFVLEAVSVMLQVAYFKRTGGKRLFRMAPLHHHFEMLGLAEQKIVVRFWIVAILFGLIGLSTLKIR
ncbi:MAG: phospho-N-acetylmuramoyl-pentapeptide-transferase [bacterium]